jgi:hypothetical protein
MKGLLIAPRYNKPHRVDATSVFQPGARRFKLAHQLWRQSHQPAHVLNTGDPVLYDNHASPGVRRAAVLDAIRSASGPLDVIAIFDHGESTGLPQAHIRILQIPQLITAVRANSTTGGTSLIILLYACSAGAFGGFASHLASELGCTVYGHTTPGHSFINPHVTRFPANDYVVRPGSELWRTWAWGLRHTSLWALFPFMTQDELTSQLQDLSLLM